LTAGKWLLRYHTAASRTVNNPADPLNVDLEQLKSDFAVNTFSALVAAKEAVKGFEELSDEASKTFIFTGNLLNETPKVPVVGFGSMLTLLIFFCFRCDG